MKTMKPKKYADGGMVEREDALEEAMEAAYPSGAVISPMGTDGLCRQSTSFKPNEPTGMAGPGVRSMQNYKK